MKRIKFFLAVSFLLFGITLTRAQQDSIIFEDHFDDVSSENNWHHTTDYRGGGEFHVVNGQFLRTTGSFVFYYNTEFKSGVAEYSFDARGPWVFFWRGSSADSASGKAIAIGAGDGLISYGEADWWGSVYRYHNNASSNVSGAFLGQYITDSLNHIRIVDDSLSARVYVNGQLVLTPNITPSFRNYGYIEIGCNHPLDTAAFDNIVIKRRTFVANPVYHINAMSGPYGSISPFGNIAVDSDSNISFTMIPNPGYMVDGLFVDGVHVDSTLSYTFNNVNADHAIFATFTSADSTAQFSIPLRISDNGGTFDTLRFGVHPQATFCADDSLGEDLLPPIPPIGVFETRFLNPRSGPVECFGAGLQLDLRPLINSTQIDTYKVFLQSGAGGFPMTLSWPDLNSYYTGPVRMIDDLTRGVFINVDMKAQTSLAVTNTNFSQLLIIAGGPPDSITATYPVQDQWNIVSVPLIVNDYSKSYLYPTATSSAFRYAAGYVASDSLENGVGYWLKFNGDQAIPMSGFRSALDSISVTQGWNLIGSISFPVTPAYNIRSDVPGMTTSPFWSFGDEYRRSNILQPGKGYWVKVSHSGKLILSTYPSNPFDRITIVPATEIPLPINSGNQFTIPLRITDNSKADTLFFGVHPDATYCMDISLGEVQLPPPPPVGVFDARFLEPVLYSNPESCIGTGMPFDIRPYMNSSQVDTYRVHFQSSAGYPIAFSWPDLNTYYTGTVNLVDDISGTLVNVNMKSQLSYSLTNSLIHDLLIIASGPVSNAPPPGLDPQYPIAFKIFNGATGFPNKSDTLFFGTDSMATYCLDASLGEAALPPVPPMGVFDARFVEPVSGYADTCFGFGTKIDIREYRNPSQVDVYRVRFQNGAAGYPITFSWSDPSPYYTVPVRLVDQLTGVIVNIDMKSQSYFLLTDPLIRELMIVVGDTIYSPSYDTTSYRTFSQEDYAQRTRRLRNGMIPTAANVRDETFVGTGWFDNGLYVGIPKLDSTKYYGWLYFRRNIYRLSRFLPHTGPARGFDFYISGKPWHYSRANPAVKYHDNHLAGEQYTLKFNIGASDIGVTPIGFGDLIYSDPLMLSSPFNGKTVRQIMAHTDSVLTFYKNYPPEYFAELDSCLSKINNAFVGPITGYTISPLTVTGSRPLGDVPFLHANPSATPVVIPRVERSPEELEPLDFALYQNYPNPFNPVTRIEFNVPQPSRASLIIYNILGQEIATLFDGINLPEGRESIEFDGSSLPSGVYFYRLTLIDEAENTTQHVQMKKMVLMK